jgi:integrase
MARARPKTFGAVVRHPVTGRQFRVRAPTAAQLEQKRERVRFIRSALHAGELSDAQAHDMLRALRGRERVTLARAAEGYIARESLADNTRRDVRSLLRGAGAKLAPLELSAIDMSRVKKWIDQLRARQVAVSSILCYWRRLRAIATYAIERDWIATLPWGDFVPRLQGRDPRPREVCRTVGELARLLSAAREIDRDDVALGRPRYLEAKITTAVALGLRQGELAGLRWSDVDQEQCIVVVARQYAGSLTKTRHRPKRLEVDPELFVVLGAHRASLAARSLYAPDGPVFPAPLRSQTGYPRPYTQGECLTTVSLRSVVEKAGLPNIRGWSPHSLRGTFATLEAIGQGGDFAAVAQRTRHRSLSALARYLRAAGRVDPAPGFVLPSGSVADLAQLVLPQRDDAPVK